MTSFCDTHCHLDFAAFEADRASVLDRARQVGVRRFLIPGIDLETSLRSLELARENDDVYAAVGIHPNQANHWESGTVERLRSLAGEPEVVAIGEIGLDYYREHSSVAEQHHAFTAQLELAAELGLPVIIHNRDASPAVMKVLEEWHSDLVEFGSDLADRAGVLHSYSDGLETADEAGRLGLFLGITGPITFKKSTALRETVSAIPLNRLLIETDSPYLSPEPFRGRRNEPAHVRFVAEKIAELHGTSVEAVSEKTSENARRLFLW